MSLDLTSGKASHRDDPQARKPACCRYRRLLLRATRTWPYHSDAHAHTDPSLNRICIREFFCRVFLPRSFTVLSSDEYGIRKAESMVLLFFRAARIRLFPVQIMIRSIISLMPLMRVILITSGLRHMIHRICIRDECENETGQPGFRMGF